MRISQLEAIAADGGRVALWGWGREGRAAHCAVRARLPHLPLTLFCPVSEHASVAALGDPLLDIRPPPDAEALAACAVVVKSPGISPYGPEARAAAERGTRFVGGTGLWFAERADARVICITGTKGKSTSTALLAHLLREGGVRTALAGNIGLPLLELLDAEAETWAIEVSSYQTRDVADSGVRPDVAVVTNLFPEHLDWHGSEERYLEDKLALVVEARPRVAVLNAEDPRLRDVGSRLSDGEVRWFGTPGGWHLRGDLLHRADVEVLDTRGVPLPGRHNRGNLCAVLTALEAGGHDALSLARHAATFQPLPHRLQALGMRHGVTWVNDSISTTPHATLAALDVYRGHRVALLVGGHDRGLDWSGFADAMRDSAPAAIVAMGGNGDRIHGELMPVAAAGGFTLARADGLEDAVAGALAALDGNGVVLMSPGAPSFGAYSDYTERGRHFAALAGFDPEAISAIQGLGIA